MSDALFVWVLRRSSRDPQLAQDGYVHGIYATKEAAHHAMILMGYHDFWSVDTHCDDDMWTTSARRHGEKCWFCATRTEVINAVPVEVEVGMHVQGRRGGFVEVVLEVTCDHVIVQPVGTTRRIAMRRWDFWEIHKQV
jgi:hypothetical protein